jgi:hypothetical protein
MSFCQHSLQYAEKKVPENSLFSLVPGLFQSPEKKTKEANSC